MKKKYSLKNNLNWLGRRFLKKDLASNLNISTTSLYRYSKGYRKIPKDILYKAEKLRNISPKTTAKNTRLKRSRFKKFKKVVKQDLYLISKKTNSTGQSIKHVFEYQGHPKNIEAYINQIADQYGRNDNVVYRIIKTVYQDNFIFDSTYNFHIDSIDKLINNFKRIMAKYQDNTTKENDFISIQIERTEYI